MFFSCTSLSLPLSSSLSLSLATLREALHVVLEKRRVHIQMELQLLAIRMVQVYDRTKTLQGHRMLEKGSQRHLLALFHEIHLQRSPVTICYTDGFTVRTP